MTFARTGTRPANSSNAGRNLYHLCTLTSKSAKIPRCTVRQHLHIPPIHTALLRLSLAPNIDVFRDCQFGRYSAVFAFLCPKNEFAIGLPYYALNLKGTSIRPNTPKGGVITPSSRQRCITSHTVSSM